MTQDELRMAVRYDRIQYYYSIKQDHEDFFFIKNNNNKGQLDKQPF